MIYIMSALVVFLVAESARQGRWVLIKWWAAPAVGLVVLDAYERSVLSAIVLGFGFLLIFAVAYRSRAQRAGVGVRKEST